MFGLFKKKLTVDSFLKEIENFSNTISDKDEFHKKVYSYCSAINSPDIDIHFHKQLFQCMSFMESAKLRDGLTDSDRVKSALILQGVCMDIADRIKVYPSQFVVTFHNYCVYLVKNGLSKEISTILFYIYSGMRHRFDSAIENHWGIDELIIRNRVFMQFYSIILANLVNDEKTFGLGMDGIYNNVAKNSLDTFCKNNIIFTFIPTDYYSEINIATTVFDEKLENSMTINIKLDKPIPQKCIIINPNTGKPVSCFISALLSDPDIATDTPSFQGEIISHPELDNLQIYEQFHL